MVSGETLLIALVVALTYFVGTEVVHGIKWVGHKAKAGIHHVIHPHDHASNNPT